MDTPQAIIIPREYSKYLEYDAAFKQANPDDACCVFCNKSCMSRSSCGGRYMSLQGGFGKSRQVDVLSACDYCFDLYDDKNLDGAHLRFYKAHKKPFIVESIYRAND